jgi:hypothetical protein
LIIIRRNRRISFGLHRKFHKRQSLWPLGVIILGHVHVEHVPVRLKHRANIVLTRVPSNIAHEHGHAWQIARMRTFAFGRRGAAIAAIGIGDWGIAATRIGAVGVARGDHRRRTAWVIVVRDSFVFVVVI